ncbi:bifunctional aspartate transaminase/aspartate 4-decarboxylase [Streptomyces sp. MJM1172]|uniref:bifunctional aspartate transaminase/aspartate 4-decarboxylase n=1 Tax=Streptomyces sp. MJM1172 TaxID=1703926 RepID=UPI00093F99CB|nr:bifunctional aspartate transaminase/aspartate 4-decarboxylase [Streptomyces sp. MJM1172]OKI71206.1 aspartate aminotransferase [Streptomyces sp. MJM1172]
MAPSGERPAAHRTRVGACGGRTSAVSESGFSLYAGRGNPNWSATGPREAFHALGYFALDESRRVWTADNLGGMPERRGIGERFGSWVRRHPQLPGVELLAACVQYALARWAFDKDEFVHELADAVTGDNYPLPGRMLTHAEHIVRGYLGFEMFGTRPPKGDMSLFATEGAAAAMCYVFDSLVTNGILAEGDKVALMAPAFTPYVEVPELDAYGFEVVEVRASRCAETGVRQWHYPREEVAKLADPAVRLVCVANPGNPPSPAPGDRVAEQIKEIVATANPRLLIVTDDVYGTFVPGFHSLAADVPRNTLLVYSYSKHFGCTGWRLGVIGLHDDNVIDEMIADLPRERKDRLARRYRSLTPEPEKLRFIDRLAADSRPVAPRHTAGLSLPQQAMMVLFSLFDLLEEGQAYKERVRQILRQRLDLLLEGARMQTADDGRRPGHHVELDLLAEAERVHGKEFADFLEKTYEPADPVFRLAARTSAAAPPGGGSDGPEWSVRISLAGLDDMDCLKIGHHLREVFREYVAEWTRSLSPRGPAGEAGHPGAAC